MVGIFLCACLTVGTGVRIRIWLQPYYKNVYRLLVTGDGDGDCVTQPRLQPLYYSKTPFQSTIDPSKHRYVRYFIKSVLFSKHQHAAAAIALSIDCTTAVRSAVAAHVSRSKAAPHIRGCRERALVRWHTVSVDERLARGIHEGGCNALPSVLMVDPDVADAKHSGNWGRLAPPPRD